MADSPEVAAHKAALEKYVNILQQTNDPAQHAKAKAEVDRTFAAMPAAKVQAPDAGTAPGNAAPKSAWEMLTGKK